MSMYSDQSFEARKSHLKILIKLAKADNNIDKDEKRFIFDIGNQLGLNEDIILDLLVNSNLKDIVLPNTLLERLKYFYHLLFLMGIDGNIHEKEKELCRRIGFKLCFNPALINDLIKDTMKGLKEKIPEDTMIKSVIKYLN